MYLAQQIKECVSIADVLKVYGCDAGRGRTIRETGRIPCPLHHGQHDNFAYTQRSFHCYVCGAGGSVIDLVMALLHLSFRDALVQLDSDFRLGLTDVEPNIGTVYRIRKKNEQESADLRAYRREYESKTREYCLLHSISKPPDNHPSMGEYARLLGRLEYLGWWFDTHHWR